MKNLISILCMGLSMLSMGLYGKNGVSGDLRWVGTRPPTDCPVSLGIPFLKGELEADGRVVLNDRDGADIPSDCWPLAYWPDGSVKWLGVAAVVPGEAEGVRFETAGKSIKRKTVPGQKYGWTRLALSSGCPQARWRLMFPNGAVVCSTASVAKGER